jgi:hypothetical protein
MKRVALLTTLILAGLGLTPALAAEATTATQAPAKLQSGVVYAYRGNYVAPEYATANGAHVDFITQGPTTIQASPRTIKAVYSAVEIVCQGGNVTVTPNIPKITLRPSKGHYRFAVKLPGVGTTVSATGVVESANLIVGTVTVSSKLCHGSYHYSATPDPALVPTS